jgi:hypothetical protein
MSRNSLDDPAATVERWFLQKCASVSRCSATNPTVVESEYQGLLMTEPTIGLPLVLMLEQGRRLKTSRITRIMAAADGETYVDTTNNRYRIRRLFGDPA